MTMPEETRIEVASIYGAKLQRGLVELTVGEQKLQMSIAKAREVRDMLTGAIEAAISDELLVKFFRERLGFDDINKIGAMLLDFRELRQGSRSTVYPQ